jgi:hypothetical protein
MTAALAINATVNTYGKSDATGAFVPEAVHFSRFYACHREGFDNRLGAPARRKQVEGILGKHKALDLVAFFCHGLRRSLQTGHDMATVDALADAISRASAKRVVVALYACSTGATDNGFAAALRNGLHARGHEGTVYAHDRAGHATRLPYVRAFVMGEDGSDWVVDPADKPMFARWRHSLVQDMRFRYVTMTVDQVRSELRSHA